MNKNRFIVTKIYSKSDLVALFLSGAICGALFLGTVLHFDKPAKGQKDCQKCHAPEVLKIKNLAEFKKVHPSPAELRRAKSDKRLLTDLLAVQP